MIGLQEYIKKPYTVSEEADLQVPFDRIIKGKSISILFEKTYLKNIFFEKIAIIDPNINIINCNSHEEKFFESIVDTNNFIIFDNLKFCHNPNILEYINTIKNKAIIWT